MRHKFLLPLLLAAVFASSRYGAGDLSAQDLAPRDTLQAIPVLRDSVKSYNYDIAQFANETWRFVKQPTKWDGSDWLKVGVTCAATVLVIQADQPIRDLVTRDQRYYRTIPMEAGRLWAEMYPPVLLFSGFVAHSWITGDARSSKVAFEIAQAMYYAGAVRLLVGTVVGRARPYSNEGPRSFHPFSTRAPVQDYRSFPGGHCVIGFALSTVLSRNAGPLWLKGLAYVPAALTFVSRVYQDRHWTSDDVFGAVLGCYVATWVVDQHEQEVSRVHVSSIFPLTVSITLN